MMLLFEIRAKLAEIYQKYDFVIKALLKFALMFFALSRVCKVIGYSSSLSKSAMVVMISAVCAFLPSSLMVFVAVAYIFIQLMTASILIALTVTMIFLVLYLFFLRFTPKEGITVIATPLLCSLGFPYAIPLFLGIFGNILSIVPACCGVVAFYLLRVVQNNIITLDQLKQAKDEALPMYMNVVDNLLKNPPMYVMMAIFALVIVTIVVIRTIQMDYSFEISLGVGTGVMILAFIIGSLKYEMGISVPGMLFGSLFAMAITFFCMFFFRVLRYAAAEHVQFEDEQYFYYVKAVPKITAGSPKKAIRKILTQRKAEANAVEDEDEEEALEAMESMLARKDRPNAAPVSRSLARRVRNDMAPKRTESYIDDEDEDDEVVITGPKNRDGKNALSFVKDGLDKLKAMVAKKPARKPKAPVMPEEDDEEEDEAYEAYAKQSADRERLKANSKPEEAQGDDDYE